MESTFWHERWAEREIGFHQAHVNTDLIQYWPQLSIPADGHVLVPLCGKSLDMVWLAGQGHQVVGLELSKVAVEEFFDEQQVQPEVRSGDRFEIYSAGNLTILCGDFFESTPDDVGPLSAIYDRAALVALPPDMRVRYAGHLEQLVPQPVPTLLLSFTYDTSQRDGPPFSVDAAEVTRLFGTRYAIEQLDTRPFQLNETEAVELVFKMT